jgi:hypothetical protein
MMIRRSILALLFVVAVAPLRADEPVYVSFARSFYVFQEAAGVGVVTVTRTGNPATSLSVGYHCVIDNSVVDGTFTFQPNQSSKAFSVAVPNDGLFDNWGHRFPLNYYIELQPTFPVTVGANWHVPIQIVDAQPEPTISITNTAEGNSGSAFVHLTVTYSAPFKWESYLYWGASGGTATLESDYDSSTMHMLFPAGQTSADIFVKINGDQSPEPDESVYVYAWLDEFGHGPPGTITILNDDYILTPGSQRIARGTVASASVATSVPTPATDHVELSSSDPNVAAVPPFVDIPAGSLGKTFDVTAAGVGSAVITAKFPPSRGSTTTTTLVDVYASTFFSFDNPALSVTLGQTATATMHFEPAPSEPLALFLAQTNPSIASIPAFFTVGTNGVGTFTLRSTGVGTTLISTTVPASYGGGPAGFRVDVAPPTGLAIARLDSTSGPSTGGQLVRIYGEGMSGRCTAMFDGVSGQNTTSAASGFLRTSTAPHDPGTVAVTLRCGSETSVMPDAYTYTAQPSRLSRISPAIGSTTGGTVAAASGDNLRRGRCSLSFGGVAATTMQNDSATEMLVVVPPHAAGSVDVTMRCGNDLSTLANAFVYTGSDPLPQVAGANPVSGAPGDRVIVAGSGFRDTDAIFFDNTAGLDVTTTSVEHLVTVPDLPPGNTTITLRDVSGRTVQGPSFRVATSIAPQITGAPARVAASSEFRITGIGFRRSLSFLLGGAVLQPLAIASTYAQLRLPASIIAGSYPLTIAGSTTTARTIEVTDGLAVTSVSIPCSSTEGGPMVTITGNGFAAGAVVTFGSADSSDVTVRDARTILAKVPPSSGISSETITVTNRNGESGQLSNAFRYRWPDPGCGTTRRRGAAH